ncbi:MAG: hypothetical protein IIA66_11570 [Planctomycetes bacterium]|nr:hypothetical protein [Planctomycetota bacterium]
MEGIVDVFRAKVSDRSSVIGKPLREIPFSPDWVVAAIQRDSDVHVPGADDTIERGDTLLVIGRHSKQDTLKELLL